MKKKFRFNYIVISLIVIISFFDVCILLVLMISNPLTTIQYLINSCSIFSFLLLLCYLFFEFKKPHGNMLRYTMLFTGICFGLSSLIFSGPIPSKCMAIIAAGFTTYISGRLHHSKENTVFVMIITALLLSSGIITIVENGYSDFVLEYSCFLSFSQWIALSLTYYIRFREHKESAIQ